MQCGWGDSSIYWQNVKFGINYRSNWFVSSINNYVRNEAHCFKRSLPMATQRKWQQLTPVRLTRLTLLGAQCKS